MTWNLRPTLESLVLLCLGRREEKKKQKFNEAALNERNSTNKKIKQQEM